MLSQPNLQQKNIRPQRRIFYFLRKFILPFLIPFKDVETSKFKAFKPLDASQPRSHSERGQINQISFKGVEISKFLAFNPQMRVSQGSHSERGQINQISFKGVETSKFKAFKGVETSKTRLVLLTRIWLTLLVTKVLAIKQKRSIAPFIRL